MSKEIEKRRTFAIISHPDAGKTTITEKLLLFSGAIKSAGTVKSRKSDNFAKSDFLQVEQERGISVVSSVMQFSYNNHIINLLDTPGHEDFSEDTYRTLSAVDSALMVIDVAKGVEERTKKLMDICRLRSTPIITFINKLDRVGKDVIDLLDEIENILKISCVPITYPIGMGSDFKGVIHLLEDKIYLFENGKNTEIGDVKIIDDINNLSQITDNAQQILEEIDLIKGITPEFDLDKFLSAEQTPVFFGSAINNFGIQNLLDGFISYAPSPQSINAETREVCAKENDFSGFVFKIQANMDPKHHDRLAFMRIVSGEYKKGMKILQVRTGKQIKIANAINFLSSERNITDQAVAGDVIGIFNHGGIAIGDSFSSGEKLKFIGIPSFAPELFKIVTLKDPLKAKALQKGLDQLSEEGAVQVFRPFKDSSQILGAIGALQFDVTAHRLKKEYSVECSFDAVNISTMRWVIGEDKDITKLKNTTEGLALDSKGCVCYLAPNSINLDLTIQRNPDLKFFASREH